MNGRVFAVNRSPVLAWNVEVPYSDMPAAAAAAISPIVPTASDPYGRCWQNQVDPGSSFPYFGALYNNSLPPTAYRLQPGCMPNLGQFWPPTPPPDGCGRYDGNNLYFGPSVLRQHGENISSNIRNSFQGLSHYSHLVETPKAETTQRVFKQEAAHSPNVSSSNASMCSSASKSDNLNACCVVDSKVKSHSSVSHSLPKQELLTVSSGHEPYLFAPDIRSSSSLHPSTDKSIYSSAYSLKGNLSIHSPPQENIHHKTKSQSMIQENNCNASPLKNVYFSHYESENVNSAECKNFEKSSSEHFYLDHKHLTSATKSKNSHHQSPSDYNNLSNHFSKKYDYQGTQDIHMSASNQRVNDTLSLREQYKQRNLSMKIKPEKLNHYDCKYQKSNSSKCSSVIQIPEPKSSDVLNTSTMNTKLEPRDKYYMSSCSSTSPSCMVTSYATNSSPFLMSNSSSRIPTSSYQNQIYQNPCSLNKSWSYSELPMISPDNYFKPPEAAKPPSNQKQAHASPVLHEGLISVAQTAPSDIHISRDTSIIYSQNLSPYPTNHKKITYEADDEVQIIGVQNKSSSKYNGKHNSEKRVEYHHSSNIISPLCLKTEKKENLPDCISTSSEKSSADIPPKLETPECIFDKSLKQSDFDSKSDFIDKKPHSEIPRLTAMETETSEISVLNIKKECDENELITSKDDAPLPDVLPVDEEPPRNLEKISDLEMVDDKMADSPPDEPPPIKELESSLDAITSHCESDCKEDELKEPALQPQEFHEHHGLNLLVDTIEKVKLLEKNTESPKSSAPPKPSDDGGDKLSKTETASKCPSPNVLKIRGLDLLSSIAVERLVSEFDVIKIEPKDSPIVSNYPQIKEEPKQASEDESTKQSNENATKTSSTVFEMRDKLLELQKKYKQKQKELSRLKPKKRFTNIYMKCCSKSDGENSDRPLISNNSSINISSNACSPSYTNQDLKTESTAEESLSENKQKVAADTDNDKRPKRSRRPNIPFKKESSVEILSDVGPTHEDQQSHKRITRRNCSRNSSAKVRQVGNANKRELSVALHSKSIKHDQRKKFSKFRKKTEQLLPSSDLSQSNGLPSAENHQRKAKSYSLRQSSTQVSAANSEVESTNSISKAISSKRKSVNPKRYIPSKQGKMSETIIAKHLRNRILFDTSGSISDDENAKDSVSDDLYDALMKCRLIDDKGKNRSYSDGEESDMSSENLLGYPEPSKLNPENLIERQRLLALEDGLFYAGYIKECQTSNKFGIALDGQRGNKLHTFTREELLTQTIVESKPTSSELPEGTRVCAYWSQQYRCLYPGVIGKAPCPSADWSEPRVFVQFDDGDSGQIPTKNVRLIPPDIIPPGSESRVEDSNSPDLKRKQPSRDQVPRRLRSSTPKKKHKSNENESKESSCTSINDSSCDDSCSLDFSPSPSQNNCDSNSHAPKSSEKRQRKHSKRKIVSRTSCTDKKGGRRHKKHHKHHHHHHRHHHRHHHHHHSKKRKHRRKTGKGSSQDNDSSGGSIPCKSPSFAVATSTDLIEHSSTIHLPQDEQ